jgi:hypothetical protein
MSHRSVETVIGRLVTDEGFRRRFLGDPGAVLADLELTAVEREALAGIDAGALRAFTAALDRRLQKVDFETE